MSKSRPPSTSRPPDAREVALRALRARDLSVAELERRLAERGVSQEDASDAISALARTGLLEDARVAERRAASLAERGGGDALIRHRLHMLGIGSELVEEAISSLEPEPERARRVVERRGAGPRTARYLVGKGFSEETVRALVATHTGDELG
jgi:SOS response regulatory protein OraA/RecX